MPLCPKLKLFYNRCLQKSEIGPEDEEEGNFIS